MGSRPFLGKYARRRIRGDRSREHRDVKDFDNGEREENHGHDGRHEALAARSDTARCRLLPPSFSDQISTTRSSISTASCFALSKLHRERKLESRPCTMIVVVADGEGHLVVVTWFKLRSVPRLLPRALALARALQIRNLDERRAPSPTPTSAAESPDDGREVNSQIVTRRRRNPFEEMTSRLLQSTLQQNSTSSTQPTHPPGVSD